VNGHPQFEGDLDLYALGALDTEEAQELASHLEACPECMQKLQQARTRVALLALAAPPQEVPSRVKERLLKRIAGRRAEQHPARRAMFWQWQRLRWLRYRSFWPYGLWLCGLRTASCLARSTSSKPSSKR